MKTFYTINTPKAKNKEFTENDLFTIYNRGVQLGVITKEKYPDFETWLEIMEENNKIEFCEIPETIDEWMQYNGVSWSDFI